MKLKSILLLILLCNCKHVLAGLFDYIHSIRTYFGFNDPHSRADAFHTTVPYEISDLDNKFISEAAKLTGTTLSELDSCHHRVVLKLQTACSRLNDDQLSKMAVMFLNCQAAVEGRKLHPCTDEMSLKDCTFNMDAEVWNNYNLLGHRVRAMCFSIRHTQFRGLAEHTVNKLMDAAQAQLKTVSKMVEDQESLQDLTKNTLLAISHDSDQLKRQHEDLQAAQFYGQLKVENNIQKLERERLLISETHDKLLQLAQNIQTELIKADEELKLQANNVQINHNGIIQDMAIIQREVGLIFKRMEDFTNLLLKQTDQAHAQYKATLLQLSEINGTVYSLLNVISDTRKIFEEHLNWLNAALGGVAFSLEQVYAISWHICFLLLAMIGCAFLHASMRTRFLVVAHPLLNLVISLQQYSYAFNPVNLTLSLGTIILVQALIAYAYNKWKSGNLKMDVRWFKQMLTFTKKRNNGNISVTRPETLIQDYERSDVTNSNRNGFRLREEINSHSSTLVRLRNISSSSRSRSSTPLNLNGLVRSICNAKTKSGSYCKLPTAPGREFCFHHKTGHSIYDD